MYVCVCDVLLQRILLSCRRSLICKRFVRPGPWKEHAGASLPACVAVSDRPRLFCQVPASGRETQLQVTHTNTHTHTHTRTHTHPIHIYAGTHTHNHTLAYTLTWPAPYIYGVCMVIWAGECPYTRYYMVCIHTVLAKPTHVVLVHRQAYAGLSSACKYQRTTSISTHTDTHAQIHTHAHTHTHCFCMQTGVRWFCKTPASGRSRRRAATKKTLGDGSQFLAHSTIPSRNGPV